MLSSEQQRQFIKLIDYRDEISQALFHIERILKDCFPEEFDVAYQHYIPQIITALNNDDRWLPRGQVTLQDSIDRILDSENSCGGVFKFTK